MGFTSCPMLHSCVRSTCNQPANVKFDLQFLFWGFLGHDTCGKPNINFRIYGLLACSSMFCCVALMSKWSRAK